MPLTFRVAQAFLLPKAGHTSNECEDRLAINEGALAAAIADGASEASFAKLWAGCLVERFADAPVTALNDEWLTPARQAFHRAIDYTKLPWHTLEKLGRGSFSTLLGVQVEPELRRVAFIGVGDSLAAWKSVSEAGTFPYTVPEDMPPNPYLLCNLPERNEGWLEHVVSMAIDLPEGETVILLMTDALAAWYLEQLALGAAPWEELTGLGEPDAFAGWVESLRESGDLRNDDVALVSLAIDVSSVG